MRLRGARCSGLQGTYVRDAGLGERVEIVAAFQHRHDAAAGMPVGQRHQLRGDPAEVLGIQLQLRQRIPAVAVKPAEISALRLESSTAGNRRWVQA